MLNTIESAHSKLTEKISTAKKYLEIIKSIMSAIKKMIEDKSSSKTNKKYDIAIASINSIHANILLQETEELEMDYNLSTINVMSDYYGKSNTEEYNTREYYRILTRENYVLNINGILTRIIGFVNILHSVRTVLIKTESSVIENQLEDITNYVEHQKQVYITTTLEKKNYEFCKCGVKMNILPEHSKLHCPCCGKLKDIIGTAFKDEQMRPQEGQKAKHGGYDSGRHCKFHITRLQAIQPKDFSEKDLTNIEKVLIRDGYDRSKLNCEEMRTVLKDSTVRATNLNEFVPLLVKKFGGVPPPILNFEEARILEIVFNKVMQLYDIVVPEGGNKPYYPYFIFKIIENMFANNPEKLRLLDYIHLQSRDTVIKHDIVFEQICSLSDPADGLKYTPTDPGGRL